MGMAIGFGFLLSALFCFYAKGRLRQLDEDFMANEIPAQGRIISYYSERSNDGGIPHVLFVTESGKRTICKVISDSVTEDTHPKGTTVNILYHTYSKLGLEFYGARIEDEAQERPSESEILILKRSGCILAVLGLVVLLISCICTGVC